MSWYGKVWTWSKKGKKTFYDRSIFGPQCEIGDLVMAFNPTRKNGQTKKLKSFTVDC